MKHNTRRPFFLKALLVVVFFGVFALAGCTQETTQPVYFTVSFESNGGSDVTAIQVEQGRKITQSIEDPTKDDGSEFVGWYLDNETFADPWDFAVDIITHDVTLYAKWMLAQPFPTEVQMTSDDFSSSLTWIQTGMTDGSSLTLSFHTGVLATRTEIQQDEDGADVTVTIEYYEYDAAGVNVQGTVSVSDGSTIVWTPTDSIPGGVYEVVISTASQEDAVIDDLYFKGEGTESNPYLLFDSSDLLAISSKDCGSGKYYLVAHSFSAEVAYDDISGNVFNGNLNGNDLIITVTGNAGLFYELGANAVVHDLTVSGVITTATIATLGGVAIRNGGLIQNVTSRLAMTSSAGMVGNPDTKEDGGAGGLVGVNLEDGIVQDSSFIGTSSADGVIKAYIGGGGIVSINYGLIEGCTNRGTLGAYNSVESGKSMSNYSYMGGIAGFNYGTISQSGTTSTGKLLGQRYFNNGAPTDTSNNRVIGGVVGYNGATGIIEESYFNGIRVHGDQYVGGIAGINAGVIESSYSGARYYTSTQTRSYIAGRVDVGGIAGSLEGDGTVTNCYNAANVYAFEGQAYAIAERATNSVFLQTNLDGRSTGEQLYGNCTSDNPTAPVGEGNVMVENDPLVFGDGIYYTLPGTYASILGDKFLDNNGECVLAWQAGV